MGQLYVWEVTGKFSSEHIYCLPEYINKRDLNQFIVPKTKIDYNAWWGPKEEGLT